MHRSAAFYQRFCQRRVEQQLAMAGGSGIIDRRQRHRTDFHVVLRNAAVRILRRNIIRTTEVVAAGHRNNRQMAVISFRHCRKIVAAGRRPGTGDNYRFAGFKSDAGGKISRTPFVDHRIGGKEIVLLYAFRKTVISGSRRNDHIFDVILFQ